MDAALELGPKGRRQGGGDSSRNATGLTESRIVVSVKEPYMALG